MLVATRAKLTQLQHLTSWSNLWRRLAPLQSRERFVMIQKSNCFKTNCCYRLRFVASFKKRDAFSFSQMFCQAMGFVYRWQKAKVLSSHVICLSMTESKWFCEVGVWKVRSKGVSRLRVLIGWLLLSLKVWRRWVIYWCDELHHPAQPDGWKRSGDKQSNNNNNEIFIKREPLTSK